jgi:hypothetical protein
VLHARNRRRAEDIPLKSPVVIGDLAEPREVTELAERKSAIAHFNACYRLDPGNWTDKRQAWSLVGSERDGGGELSRFNQSPAPGEDADWPVDSDFDRDVAALGPGEYYPKTMTP